MVVDLDDRYDLSWLCRGQRARIRSGWGNRTVFNLSIGYYRDMIESASTREQEIAS